MRPSTESQMEDRSHLLMLDSLLIVLAMSATSSTRLEVISRDRTSQCTYPGWKPRRSMKPTRWLCLQLSGLSPKIVPSMIFSNFSNALTTPSAKDRTIIQFSSLQQKTFMLSTYSDGSQKEENAEVKEKVKDFPQNISLGTDGFFRPETVEKHRVKQDDN